MSGQPTIAAPAAGRPLRAIAGLLQWFDRTPRLLVLGFLMAIVGTFELSRVHPAPWVILETRAIGLEQTLAALDAGRPLLTTLLPSGGLYGAGGGDDQGLYLFVPWLAHVLGWQDPVNLLRWIALLAMGVTVTLWPWLVRQLTGSILVALASPFVLLFALWRLPLADIYWVTAWVILTLVPLLLLLDRRWPRHGLALLLGFLVLASLASSIRSQAGLPILIGAVLVLLRRPWSQGLKTGAVVLCIVAYLSVNTFGMAGARAVRDHQIGEQALTVSEGQGHPFWHTAYIGLGYIPNKWDIQYYDSIGYRDVLRVDPKARFLGPAYGSILRDRYFELLGDDPGFGARLYGAKLVGALRPAAPALLVLALLGPWLLLADSRRRRWRRDGVFILAAALVGIASPLIATPYAAYLLGWLAAALLAAVIAVGAVASGWRPAVEYVRSLRSGAAARRRAVVGASAVGLVVVAVVLAAGPGLARTAEKWNATPPPGVPQPADATH